MLAVPLYTKAKVQTFMCTHNFCKHFLCIYTFSAKIDIVVLVVDSFPRVNEHLHKGRSLFQCYLYTLQRFGEKSILFIHEVRA